MQKRRSVITAPPEAARVQQWEPPVITAGKGPVPVVLESK